MKIFSFREPTSPSTTDKTAWRIPLKPFMTKHGIWNSTPEALEDAIARPTARVHEAAVAVELRE